MIAKFDIYNYRDMYRNCGVLAAAAPEDHSAWRYLDLTFESSRCVIFGSNGVQLARVVIPCEMHGIPYDYHIMIHPIKPTSHTKSVELHIDEATETYTIIFVDSEDEILDSVTESFYKAPPVGFDRLYKKLEENFGPKGEGQYSIAVNPKVLLRTLEGLKGYDKVIFNFASIVEPFRVFPETDDQDIECMVYPMRLWS